MKESRTFLEFRLVFLSSSVFSSKRFSLDVFLGLVTEEQHQPHSPSASDIKRIIQFLSHIQSSNNPPFLFHYMFVSECFGVEHQISDVSEESEGCTQSFLVKLSGEHCVVLCECRSPTGPFVCC